MPATNFDELKQALSERYPDLSPQLQRIARFALDRPNELALGTVAAIADAAGVQPSAMVRFANALDFGGFSQMQLIFRERLVERSASYRERIEQMRQSRRAGERTGGSEVVLHQAVNEGDRRTWTPRGNRNRRAVCGSDPAARRRHRMSMCSRSGARFRWRATSRTR